MQTSNGSQVICRPRCPMCMMERPYPRGLQVSQSLRMGIQSVAHSRRTPISLLGQALHKEPSSVVSQETEIAGNDVRDGLVPENKRLQLHYFTGWKEAILRFSMNGNQWSNLPFSKVASSDKWHRVELGMNGDLTRFIQMEFVVTNGQGEWDKPASGSNYVIESKGTFSIKDGRVQSVRGKPVMVVSDLDGTMVGDDAATAGFKEFWQSDALLRGSVLVYNTGRSLEGFKSLMDEKFHCLNAPDVLICSVGTKIYKNHGSGGWVEDEGWLKRLDEGWNLDKVREIAYSALNTAGTDLMHFRPPDEQNDHKVTCGVNVSVLALVLHELTAGLESKGVVANIIASGVGEWRYVDIVPKQAGKLEALNFVREMNQFSIASTVACGDSGNDILMLSGENPAIVVGNAQPDLVDWVTECQRKEGSDSRLFFSTRKEADGILDGLRHFGFRA